MRTTTDRFNYISLKDKYGKIVNHQLIFYAKSGYNKGITGESVVEKFHKNGYIILILSDPKMECEYAYSQFYPEEKYHLDALKKIGKKPGRQQIRLYHPLTHNLPINRLLPEMNIFTVPIKSFGEAEWGLILETEGQSEAISLLLKASKDLSKEDGMYAFINSFEKLVEGKKENKKMVRDWDNYGIKVKFGSPKEQTKIMQNLDIFKQHPFLAKQNCETNLDWKKILTDQENYHVFVSNYIGRQDEKVRDFLVLYLLENILKNKTTLKKPILIVIPEISYLCNFRPEGHKKFLAKSIQKNLKSIRSEGRGMSSLLDSQVWGNVSEEIRGSSTVSFYGELGDVKDVENLCKATGWGKSIKDQLSSAEVFRSYLVRGLDTQGQGSSMDLGGYMALYPKSMHCEPSYNFEEMYRKHHQENPEKYPMESYKELYNNLMKMFKDEEKKIKDRIMRKEKSEEDEEAKKEKEKEAKQSGDKDIEIKKEKIQRRSDEVKEKIMKLCYDMYNDEGLDSKERSYRKIAEKFEIKSHKTAKKYIEDYSKIAKENETKDFQDEFVESVEN